MYGELRFRVGRLGLGFRTVWGVKGLVWHSVSISGAESEVWVSVRVRGKVSCYGSGRV
jgi:hypothetical protein